MTVRFVSIATAFAATLVLAIGAGTASAQYRSPDSAPYPIEADTPAEQPAAKPPAKSAVKPAAKPAAKEPAATAAVKPASLPSTKPDAAKSIPKAEPSRDVFAGIEQDERLKLQAALLWSGDYTGAANGEDPMLTAVKNFQKRIKAKVTGQLTEQERATLLAAAREHEQEFGWSVVADPATGIRIADDKDNGLALLRVYGPRKLTPLTLAHDTAASKTGDVTLVGIPDPKEHNSRGKLVEIKARLANGNAIELRQPVPMAGFSGAAALDGQGRFLGMAEMRNAVLASTTPAAPPVRLVRTQTIREFLDAHHVPVATASAADARDSIVRVICVRK